MSTIIENKDTFDSFRREFPEFVYEGYSWTLTEKVLTISFTYVLSPGDTITTSTEVVFPDAVSEEKIKANEYLIFRMGLIEALSYWKAHCSPKIKIACGALSEAEISWWRDTWYDGMGEFRYRNGLLGVSKEEWVEFVIDSNASILVASQIESELSGNLVAFTGGKDSTLALALVRDGMPEEENETFFISNGVPEKREDIKRMLGVSYPETLIKRSIHPRLLALNAEGALNGHTPFSIIAGFVGVFVASVRSRKYVIVANESSADEATVAGTDINHQYSKSFVFEKRFQAYIQMIAPDAPYYFSLVRPLSEIGITELLKKYPDTLPFISSCNTKTKQGLWCGACPKCLFATLLFSASYNIAFANGMLGADMLENLEYLPMLEELTGVRTAKPFECVGTTKESLALLSRIRYLEGDTKALIARFASVHGARLPEPSTFEQIAKEFHEHSVPEKFTRLLEA